MARHPGTLVVLMALGTMLIAGCRPTAKVTSHGGPSIAEAQREAYDGSKARVAVSRFSDKTAKGSTWYSAQIGDGMADMLATLLFHTNRYVVVERQELGDVLAEQDLGASGRVRKETAAPIGEIEGAELLVTGAVTEFEPGASGGGAVLPGIGGGVRKSHVAIDLRVVDARTSRNVLATSVEGTASDVGGFTTMGVGGLGGYAKTPIEKAIRIALDAAVQFMVSQTPAQYYRH